jgi:hypothetical protein
VYQLDTVSIECHNFNFEIRTALEACRQADGLGRKYYALGFGGRSGSQCGYFREYGAADRNNADFPFYIWALEEWLMVTSALIGAGEEAGLAPSVS